VLTTVVASDREENGEFCLAVGPATRTAGMLTQLVKGAGCYNLCVVILAYAAMLGYWVNQWCYA